MTWIDDAKKQVGNEMEQERLSTETELREKEEDFRHLIPDTVSEIETIFSRAQTEGLKISEAKLIRTPYIKAGCFWPFNNGGHRGVHMMQWRISYNDWHLDIEVGIGSTGIPILYIPSPGGGKHLNNVSEIETEIKSWLYGYYKSVS